MTCGCSSSSSTKELFRGNDQILTVEGITAQATSLPVSDATVSATLQDGDGNDVEGLTDLELDATGSPFTGDYSGQIQGSQFNPSVGNYTLLVTVNSSEGMMSLSVPVVVLDRTQ